MASQPQTKIPTIEEKVEETLRTKSYTSLANYCLQKEVIEDAGDRKIDSEIFYSLQMVCYLLNNDVLNARFLWKRLPKEFKKSKDLACLWKIGQALWKKDAVQFYANSDPKEFSKLIRPCVNALVIATRERYQTAIATSYTSISLAQCAEQLGLPKNQAAEYVTGLKWQVEKELVLPRRPPINKQQETSAQQLHQLTNYITHLEEK